MPSVREREREREKARMEPTERSGCTCRCIGSGGQTRIRAVAPAHLPHPLVAGRRITVPPLAGRCPGPLFLVPLFFRRLAARPERRPALRRSRIARSRGRSFSRNASVRSAAALFRGGKSEGARSPSRPFPPPFRSKCDQRARSLMNDAPRDTRPACTFGILVSFRSREARECATSPEGRRDVVTRTRPPSLLHRRNGLTCHV